MKEKENSFEILKRKFDGMLFHCMDLLDWTKEHMDDPIFETEEGQKLRHHIISICSNHAMGSMIIMMKDLKEKRENKSESFGMDFEEMLKRSIDND